LGRHDCFGGKAVAPTDALGAVAPDDDRSHRLRIGTRPLVPGEAEALASLRLRAVTGPGDGVEMADR
jgi:hypothetical protein